MVNDFNSNYAIIMNQKNTNPMKKIDWDYDTPFIIKDKIRGYTDGEVLDTLNMMTEKTNALIRELKRRGVKT